MLIYYRWLLLCIALVSTCFVLTFTRGGGGRGGGGRGGGGRGGSSGGRGSSRGSSYGSGRVSSSSTSGGKGSGSSGSSNFGSKPSPSLSQPSSSNGRPSYHAHQYHHRWQPSYSSSSRLDSELGYKPSSYDTYTTYRPFINFPSIEPFTIPTLRPILSGGFNEYDRDRSRKHGNCEPFSSLDLPCPERYEALMNSKSMFDLIEHDNQYENTPYRRTSYKEYNSEQPFKFESRSNPSSENNRQSGNCSPYSEMKLPCPEEYESSMRESSSSDLTLSNKNPKNSLYEAKTSTKPRKKKKKKPTKPSSLIAKNNSTTQNQAQSKSDKTYPCVNRRYPEHYLGRYTWQPYCSSPPPAYMNYVGIPTGTNMDEKSHKRKGFIGSLMSAGKSESISKNQTKYHGIYPSPYGITHLKNDDKYNSSASLYTIFPFASPKYTQKVHRRNFPSVLMHMPSRHSNQHRYQHPHEYRQDVNYAVYFNIFDDNYVGKCQQPLNDQHSDVKCKTNPDEIKCNASCINGYQFPRSIDLLANHCWHVTGVWKPQKNFPECKPVCNEECQNGGDCIRPDECRCAPEFRGPRCQFHFLECDIRLLVADENRLSWTCRHSKSETICKIKCKEPAQFESFPAAQYKCTPNGTWTPDTLPRCIVKERR